MTNIKFDDFFQAWEKLCINKINTLKDAWKSKSKYTDLILYSENSIIFEVCKEIKQSFGIELLKYSYCRAGYYGIDAVFYEQKNKLNTESGVWLKKINIAFEHENDSSYLFTEISRLLTCNSDLKVLVSYSNNKEKVFNEIKELFNFVEDDIYIILGPYELLQNEIKWDKYLLNCRGISKLDF